ncbi:MAG: glycerol-3-phosphate acyltransferase [Actinomycetota bacterium]
MILLAGAAGYLIGSIPTAVFLGRLRGVDLRKEGSGNPGTSNALRTGGRALACAVLALEAAKGYLAVRAGEWMADDAAAIAGGLGAVAGNVYNIWYRFDGGKGLGISFGILAGLWPAVLVPVAIVIFAGMRLSGSSGMAALATMATLVVMAVLWWVYAWPTGGIRPTGQLMVVAIGISVIIFQRHWRDAPFTARARR